MPSLVAILILHTALRFWNDDAVKATGASVILLLCMWIVHRKGGWTSFRNAVDWLKGHRTVGISMLIGAVLSIDQLFFSKATDPISTRAAYFIEGVFFFYAGLAAVHSFGTAASQYLQGLSGRNRP